MLKGKKLDMEALVSEVFEQFARQAVRNVISEDAGYGIESEVKAAIRKEADRLVMEDPEVRGLIRDSVVRWISKQ